MSFLFDLMRSMKEGFVHGSESLSSIYDRNEGKGDTDQLFRILIHGNDLLSAEEYEDRIEKADKLIGVRTLLSVLPISSNLSIGA